MYKRRNYIDWEEYSRLKELNYTDRAIAKILNIPAPALSSYKRKEYGVYLATHKPFKGDLTMKSKQGTLMYKFFTNSEIEYEAAIMKHGAEEDKTLEQIFSYLVEEVGEVSTAIQNKDKQNLKEELCQVVAMCYKIYRRL